MPSAGTFETRINRMTFPGADTDGAIFSLPLAKQTYRVLITGAIFLRFQLLLDLRMLQEAANIADSLPTDTPLAMTLKAQVLAHSARHKKAADLADKILRDPRTPARLALQVELLTGKQSDRMVRLGSAARRMDNRFFMASLFQKNWFGDMAKQFYVEGLREHPLRFSAYRELITVTGTVSPVETALETYDRIWLLHLAAGDVYARHPNPTEAEKSLAYYKRADILAPLDAEPVLRAHQVLRRFGQKSGAAALLKDKLNRGKATGSAELRMRLALANTYLELKQPEMTLAAMAPLTPSGGPAVELVAARVLEFKGDYRKAFAAYQNIVERFPGNARVLASVAGFNWRMGRFKVAADLVAAGRTAGMSGCQWYLADFAAALGHGSENRLLAAVTALMEAGIPVSEIRCLAFALEERKAFPAAFALMNFVRMESPGNHLELAARMAVLLTAWNGEAAAERFLKDHLTTPLPPEQAAVLYRFGLFTTILNQMGDPSAYPEEHRERVRWLYLAAWLNSGRTAAGLDKSIIDHYRGNWLQRKRAQITGRISSDPDHLAGRYLLGMISRTEFLERIDHSRQRCQYPYVIGLSKRAIRRFPEAAAWYQLSRESLQKTRMEFHWATNEMYWWAHLGTDNRNRNLDADISEYFQSLTELPKRNW